MNTTNDVIPDDWSRLAAASRSLIADRGLAKFSLRNLARESGWTIGELSYRTGNKDQLIGRLLAAENDDWSSSNGDWFSLLSAVPSFGKYELAAVITSYIDHFAIERRPASIFRYEMLVAGDLQPSIQQQMSQWLSLSQEHWHRLLEGKIKAAEAYARVIHAYILGELSFSLALGHDPAYRMARQICIHRLCHGILEAGGDAGGGKLLGTLLASEHSSDTAAPSYSERAWLTATAAAHLIAEKGVAALSHRAVGDRLGISGSAVAYHFPSRSALFAAAIDVLNEVARQSREIGAGSGDDDRHASNEMGKPIYGSLVRSLVIMALSATRDNELEPLVRRLRLERGKHSYVENRKLGVRNGFDRWAAQLSSMVMFGGSIQAVVWGDGLAENLSSLRADLDILAT